MELIVFLHLSFFMVKRTGVYLKNWIYTILELLWGSTTQPTWMTSSSSNISNYIWFQFLMVDLRCLLLIDVDNRKDWQFLILYRNKWLSLHRFLQGVLVCFNLRMFLSISRWSSPFENSQMKQFGIGNLRVTLKSGALDNGTFLLLGTLTHASRFEL